MSSYTQLTYHIIFATKYRKRTISENVRERLYEYIGGILRARQGQLIEIGGVTDHVHILSELSPNLAVAEVIRDTKANSSRWMNDLPEIRQRFEWQKGYSAFTVSHSQVESVRDYIRRQEEHHKHTTFQDEYIEFLKRHNLAFDRKYLFENEHHG